ncbi:MAG: RNA recognition motif domain-containing protein [Terriglobia bacterium]
MKKLYVGNLPFQATEDDLRDWFANAGVTQSVVQIIRDRFSGNSRGFAFVEVGNDTEADNAVQMLNGKDFQGRALIVNEARPQREQGGGGGGGGRGRSGGGGGGGRDRGGSRGRSW